MKIFYIIKRKDEKIESAIDQYMTVGLHSLYKSHTSLEKLYAEGLVRFPGFFLEDHEIVEVTVDDLNDCFKITAKTLKDKK